MRVALAVLLLTVTACTCHGYHGPPSPMAVGATLREDFGGSCADLGDPFMYTPSCRGPKVVEFTRAEVGAPFELLPAPTEGLWADHPHIAVRANAVGKSTLKVEAIYDDNKTDAWSWPLEAREPTRTLLQPKCWQLDGGAGPQGYLVLPGTELAVEYFVGDDGGWLFTKEFAPFTTTGLTFASPGPGSTNRLLVEVTSDGGLARMTPIPDPSNTLDFEVVDPALVEVVALSPSRHPSGESDLRLQARHGGVPFCALPHAAWAAGSETQDVCLIAGEGLKTSHVENELPTFKLARITEGTCSIIVRSGRVDARVVVP